MIELALLSCALLTGAAYLYVAEQQRLKNLRENTMTKQIKTDNEWRSMAVNPDTKKKTLVILNHHFNSADVVPLSVSTPNMIEAVEAGFTHTLRGFQGKVFISLREAEDVRIQGDEVYSNEEVQYRYGYIVSEVNS